jgi:hypothetical protein
MRNLLLIAAKIISLIALLPLAGTLADPLFNHPFMPTFFDPLLLVCPDHVEALRWHDPSGGREQPLRLECSFQIPPARQAWVENAVKQLQSPLPWNPSWFIRVKQVGVSDQRIEFESCGGKGCIGTIYEVRNGAATPLKTRIDEPEGGLFIIFIYGLLLIPWWLAWVGLGHVAPHWFKLHVRKTKLLTGTYNGIEWSLIYGVLAHGE